VPRRRTKTWGDPIKWDRLAKISGYRPRVFCASLADVFDNQVPIGWFLDLLDLIRRTPNLDWMLLTKRPQIIKKRLQAALAAIPRAIAHLWGWVSDWLAGEPPANVWLGVTAENQEEARRRIPDVLAIAAQVHFVSCEPLLGLVDLTRLRPLGTHDCYDALNGTYALGEDAPRPGYKALDLVIAGGETGPKARPTHPDWPRSLRDQCRAAGTAFFFKQWGEFHPSDDHEAGDHAGCVDALVTVGDPSRGERRANLCRVGRKAAGRVLDGRTWSQLPGYTHG
jgi:protein gp37